MDQIKFMLGQALGRQEGMEKRLEEIANRVCSIQDRQHTVMVWSERIGQTLLHLSSSVMELEKGHRAMRRRVEKVERAPKLDQLIKYGLSILVVWSTIIRASSQADLLEILKTLLGLK